MKRGAQLKIILTAINAKFIHTNLAVRSIARYVAHRGQRGVEMAEYTINHRPRGILEDLFARRGDVYLFSCYIWNIELAVTVARELRKVLPQAVLLAGGPEASAHPRYFLRENPCFSAVVAGEGEATCRELFSLMDRGEDWRGCAGLSLPQADNPPRAPLSMDALPFAYGDLGDLRHRILYYESMRGCPFRCAYCLSSLSQGVRMRGLELVFGDLKRFLDAGVPQVKLVDRTFNADPGRAMDIWRFLAEHDNGVTNFHFELAGDLLDDEALAFLPTLRPGQFQFEIGVQSANPQTLEAIRRACDLDKLAVRVRALRAAGNIHLHLDLIAGLPVEDFESFGNSFDWVYRLAPHQLQLGFLKVLGGSEMERRAGEYGIVYESRPPFQVLCTNRLTFGELSELERVAEMVDAYYNSGRFGNILKHLCAQFPSPFAFYRSLASFWHGRGHETEPLSKIGYYDLLGAFMAHSGVPVSQRAQWLCKLDLAGHEKIRKLPGWVAVDGTPPLRERIRQFYRSEENISRYLPGYVAREPGYIAKVCHIEVFPPGILPGEPEETALLFDYSRRDPLGRAVIQKIQL